MALTSNEVEVGFGATNLDLKHGAYNLVKKQTEGVISKVFCPAHDSVTNDPVKKRSGSDCRSLKQRQKNKPMNEQCSWLILRHFPVTPTVWFSGDPKRLRNKGKLEENANVLILGSPVSWLFTINKKFPEKPVGK